MVIAFFITVFLAMLSLVLALSAINTGKVKLGLSGGLNPCVPPPRTRKPK